MGTKMHGNDGYIPLLYLKKNRFGMNLPHFSESLREIPRGKFGERKCLPVVDPW